MSKKRFDYNLIGIENYISDIEHIRLLEKHLSFMISLINGTKNPMNEKQNNFIRVIKNNLPPEDTYQEIYFKFISFYNDKQKKRIELQKEKSTIDEAPPGLKAYPDHYWERIKNVEWDTTKGRLK